MTTLRALRLANPLRVVRLLGFASVLGIIAASEVSARADRQQIGVQLVADGLIAPVDVTFAPEDDKDRRFIVDQTGFVLVLKLDGAVQATPFLDITDRVVIQSQFDERGLLALAFHPRFKKNGRLYVQYSAAREGPNILRR